MLLAQDGSENAVAVAGKKGDFQQLHVSLGMIKPLMYNQGITAALGRDLG